MSPSTASSAGQRDRIVGSSAASEDSQVTEMVVRVEWLATRPLDQAFREKELFASQVTACKLRDEHTIKTVEAAFGLGAESS
jgi:hypothetical protein